MKDFRDILIEQFTDGIIATSCFIMDNPNGADQYSCPFCGAYKKAKRIEYTTMHELNHDKYCLYLSAIKYQAMGSDEYILCSAIDYYGKTISGFRHKDCYNTIRLINPNITEEELPERYLCGFLTSKNRFVNRKEAWKIALVNNQIKYGLKASDNGENSELISENLYMLEDE